MPVGRRRSLPPDTPVVEARTAREPFATLFVAPEQASGFRVRHDPPPTLMIWGVSPGPEASVER